MKSLYPLPLVSAVITTHRRPLVLREAIASVVAEVYANVELVIAEDGDELDERDFEGLGIPWRLVGRDVGGVAGARNLGLESARGEYVIFLDDDDLARPDRIATLMHVAVAGRYDLCYGRTLKINPSPPDDAYRIPTYPASDHEVGFRDMLTCMPHVNAMLGRTELMREAGGFNTMTPNFDEWALWLMCIDRGARAYFSDAVVADWRLHGEGLTGEVNRGSGLGTFVVGMLRTLQPMISSDNRAFLDAALSVAERTPIVAYDNYADAMNALFEGKSSSSVEKGMGRL